MHWYAEQVLAVEQVMTDNGTTYVSRRWRATRRELDLEHLRNWARAFAYRSSAHRAWALAGWLRWYNRRRPHASLGGLPPASRVPHLRGLHS